MTKRKHKNKKKDIIIKKNSHNHFIIFGILVVIWGIALYYNQWVTLEKLSNAINPIARFGTINTFFSFLNRYGYKIFNGFDKFIFYLILFLPLIFLYMEWKNKTLSKLVEIAPKKNRYIILYLLLLCFLFLRSYFALGHDMYTGDAPYFLLLTRLMQNSFKNFHLFPFWTFLYGGGAPFNQFYGPLHSYISGFFALFVNIYIANKLTLFLFHFVAVVGIYLFIKELTNSKKSAFISALAGILLYHHIHVLLFPGRYGIAAAWAIYPYLFYFLERSLKKNSIVNFLGISISISFLLFASLGMSFYFILFWGILVIFRLLFIKKSVKEKFLWAFYFILAVFLGFSLSSYYIWSFLKETKWSVQQTFDKFKITGIGKNIFKQIFLWNNYQISLFNFKYAWQTSYFGISLILVSFFAMILIIKTKVKKYFPILFTLIILLIYIIGYGKIKLLMKIPYLHVYSQVRSFNIFAFWIIFLTGIGFSLIVQKTRKKQKFFILFSLIIMGDLFFTTFHDTWGKQYGGYAYPFFRYIKQLKKDHHPSLNRVDLLGKGVSRSIQHNWRAFDALMAETEYPIVAETIWDFKNVKNFINYVKLKNIQNSKTNLWKNYYSLFNTKYIFASQNIDHPFFRLLGKNKNISFYQTKTNSPVFFTTKLSNVKFSTNLIFKFLNDTKINYKNLEINRMWCSDLPTTNLKGNVHGKIIDHKIIKGKVHLKVQSDIPSFAILSYSAYPTIKTYLNNKPIKFYKTFYGFIVIPLPKGENSITIVPKRTKKSFVALILSLFLYTLIIVFFMYKIIVFLMYKLKNRKEL